MGVYISYLVACGHLPRPSKEGKPLPQLELSAEALEGSRRSDAK